jgi:uncharacterized Zn-finger protein
MGEDMADGIARPETTEVATREVACDGGGVLGHPRVYLNMGTGDWVECPYCDRRFVLVAGAEAAGTGH